MENVPKIYSSLIGIMSDINPIKKEKKNAQQGFMYRGIDDFMNELHSLFAKHGVIIVPECLTRTEDERQSQKGNALFYVKERIKYTFYAEDGSNVSAIIDGEGMDSGDKGTNKAIAIALKYCLMQMFLVPTDDLKDPDSETPPNITIIPSKKDSSNDDMSDMAKLISKATTEARDCKDIPDLERIWNKYKDLHTHETFKLCVNNMKKNIQKQQYGSN